MVNFAGFLGGLWGVWEPQKKIHTRAEHTHSGTATLHVFVAGKTAASRVDTGLSKTKVDKMSVKSIPILTIEIEEYCICCVVFELFDVFRTYSTLAGNLGRV